MKKFRKWIPLFLFLGLLPALLTGCNPESGKSDGVCSTVHSSPKRYFPDHPPHRGPHYGPAPGTRTTLRRFHPEPINHRSGFSRNSLISRDTGDWAKPHTVYTFDYVDEPNMDGSGVEDRPGCIHFDKHSVQPIINVPSRSFKITCQS